MTAATTESMQATAPHRDVSHVRAVPTATHAPREAEPERLAADHRVERVVLRHALFGALIGAAICAPLYVGLVFLSLGPSGTALAPPLAMSVGLGLYAGLFLGGSIGTLLGSKALEHYERENLPPMSSPRP